MARGGDRYSAVERARELFASARRITALTGAGMSTSAGIPDFRGPNGVWTKDPAAQRLTDIDSYVSDPQVRRLAWQRRLEHPAWEAVPSAAHGALVDLDGDGRLGSVITQNIDRLHQRAGLAREKVLELHGSMFGVRCLECGATGAMRAVLQRVAEGEEDPECRSCGGILKSTTVSFGESLDPEVLREAQRAALNCDLFLAAGTSLTVSPAAGLAELATRAGASLVICNAEPTPYDELATAALDGPLDEILPELVAVARVESRRPLNTWADPSTWS